jgi:hypothetical protein
MKNCAPPLFGLSGIRTVDTVPRTCLDVAEFIRQLTEGARTPAPAWSFASFNNGSPPSMDSARDYTMELAEPS